MFKWLTKLLLAFMALFAVSAHAAFVLDGTRFIYDSQQKSITVQVTNKSKDLFGGQVWIENGEHNPNKVYFIPSPAFFTLEPGDVQVIRLLNVDHNLPKNRESLFWLNVQSIPQKSTSSGLQFAIDTRVKLLYRPNDLELGRPEAEKKVTIENVNGQAALKNPTPYYFAVIYVSNDGHELKLNKNEKENLGIFKPFSTVSLNIPYSSVKDLSFKAINDYGGIILYKIKN